MTAVPTRARSVLFQYLVAAVALLVVLQALWAGLFVHEGRDYSQGWVEVHARGADLAIVLAVIATVVGLVRLRSRRDLWTGSAVLSVALILEAYLGGLIGQQPAVTAVHFPLAMVILVLSVWLPVRARRAA